jgi:DNA repair exonuclease SbcCD nuclease subunit
MSKRVAIVSDIHFGVNKNSELFLNSTIRFFTEEFVPYLKAEGIDTILILGDVFDNRNNIHVKINDEVYNLFINVLNEFKIYILIGNHDIYYKTSNDVHSLKLLNHLENVTVVDKICNIELFGVNTMFCPWVFDYEDPNLIEMLENPNADVLFGHFDIVGFALNSTRVSMEGLNSEIFSGFKKVFSGHYHTPSSKKLGKTEIVYIGSPYQMTRNDKNETKGFIVLNLETLRYKRVANTVSTKFIEVEYPEIPEPEVVAGNIVDALITINKKDLTGNIIDKYVEKLEKMNPAEKINVVLNVINDHLSDFETVKNKITSVKDLIELYINNDKEIDDKDQLLKIIMDIYDEVA